MANLTLTVSENVLRRARVRALEQGTSVNAVLGEYLQRFAGPNPAEDALSTFETLADAIDAGSGHDGKRWSRDELYDRARLR